MRKTWLLLLVLAVSAIGVTRPALAQADGVAPGAPASDPYNVSWAALDPGDNEWATTIIRSLFPIGGTIGTGGTSPGHETTVIQSIVGQFTGFIGAIACAFVAYSLIMHIHRAAETSRVLGQGQNWMFVVRVGFAGIMMFPLGGGFSAGQALVMQAALTGVGMARAVYANAVQAIGPDAAVVALPIIPGTQSIVAGLIDSELCMDLVNLASNTGPGAINSNLFGPGNGVEPLVAIPKPQKNINRSAGSSNYLTYSYTLSAGNNSGDPVCGTVKVIEPGAANQTIAGVSVDMAPIQQSVLTNVIGVIRPQVLQAAQNLWKNRTANDLIPLQAVYTQAVSSYTQGLTNAAMDIQKTLNTALQSHAVITQYRKGTSDLLQSQAQQANLGWTGAGAYYLSMAKTNGAVLSLLNATPVTTSPTFKGLSRSLSNDLAVPMTAAKEFMTTLAYTVQTSDATHSPSGTPYTLGDAKSDAEGASLIEQVFSKLSFTNTVFQKIAGLLAPNAQVWTDPFGSLVSLGQTLMITSLAAMGIAGVLDSGTLSTGAAIWEGLTGNFFGAVATIGGHALMSFFATPIFAGLLALLLPGIFIAYVLPMIPYVMWIGGVCGWIILVCEAMLAVPLAMLAHMTVGGEGLHGRGTEFWALLFNVVFRPTLMVIGLFMAYFVFDCTSWLIRQTFTIATSFVFQNGWLVTNFIGLVVLLNIFVMTQVTAALMSFRMVALLPHHLPRLIGFSSGGRVDMEDFVQRGATTPGELATTTAAASLKGGTKQFAANVRSLRASHGRSISGPSKDKPASDRGVMDSTLQATSSTAEGDGEE